MVGFIDRDEVQRLVAEHRAVVAEVLPRTEYDWAPTTIRPSEELVPLVQRMRHADVDALLVTISDGRLLGLLERDRGEQAIEPRPIEEH